MSFERASYISNNWQLDDWSITKECFDKIIEILPFGSTILEIGSGNSTNILSEFYNMISLESNPEWMNKFKSEYHLIPLKMFKSEIFGETNWLDADILRPVLKDLNYDLLMIDSGGDRVGIYDFIHLFKTNIPIIFDDTMCSSYLQCANMVSEKINKQCITYHCKRNKYAVFWFDGKKYSLIK
jgi:hypothetical protein